MTTFICHKVWLKSEKQILKGVAVWNFCVNEREKKY